MDGADARRGSTRPCWSASARRSTSTPGSCRRRRRRCSASAWSGCIRLCAGAAPPVAALRALQPALRVGVRAPVRASAIRATTLSRRRGGRETDQRADVGGAGGTRARRPGARGRLRRQPGDRVARRRRPVGLRPRRRTARSYERHWTGGGVDGLVVARRRTRPPGPAAVGYGSASARLHPRRRRRDLAEHVRETVAGAAGRRSAATRRRRPPSTVRRGPHGYVDLAVPRRRQRDLPPDATSPGRGWSPWASLGGNLTSAPALNSQSDGVLNVWARGTDGAVLAEGLERRRLERLGQPRRRDHRRAGRRLARRERRQRLCAAAPATPVFQRGWTATGGWGGWFLLDDTPLGSSPAAGGDSATHEWLVARARRARSCSRNGRRLRVDELERPRAPGWPSAPAAAAAHADRCRRRAGARDRAALHAARRARCASTSRSASRRAASKARVSRIVFFTKGKNRAVRVDRKSPFVVRIRINRAGGPDGPRLRPRLLPPLGEGQAAPQDGLPALRGLPLASLAAHALRRLCHRTRPDRPAARAQLRRRGALACSASTTTPSAWPRCASGGCRSRSRARTS